MTNVISGFIYGTATTDPLTFILVPFGLMMVVLDAVCLPAFRASSVDPMAALRME